MRGGDRWQQQVGCTLSVLWETFDTEELDEQEVGEPCASILHVSYKDYMQNPLRGLTPSTHAEPLAANEPIPSTPDSRSYRYRKQGKVGFSS